MRPENATNIESLLLPTRRPSGGFSSLKQSDTPPDFASLLGDAAWSGHDAGGVPVAVLRPAAGESVPAGGKVLPERRPPELTAPETMPTAETPAASAVPDAEGAADSLARMLEAPDPTLTPDDARLSAPNVTGDAGQAGTLDAASAVPAAATAIPAIPSAATASARDAGTDRVSTRPKPVDGSATPPGADRPRPTSKRVTPPLATTAQGGATPVPVTGAASAVRDAGTPSDINAAGERAVADSQDPARAVRRENVPAPAPVPSPASSAAAPSAETAAPGPVTPSVPSSSPSPSSAPTPSASVPPEPATTPTDAAARNGRESLAVPVAPPPTRATSADTPSRSARAGEVTAAIDRLTAAPTGIEPGPPSAGTARAAEPLPTAPAATARYTIAVPVQDAGWDSALSERVVMMSRDQRHTAELRLSPADLGPVRVQLLVEDGKADVSFHVQHGVTRDAIEQALPRLREMLADSGLQLGRCDVGDAGTQDRAASRDARPQTGPMIDAGKSDADEQSAPATAVRVGRGLIDTFA